MMKKVLTTTVLVFVLVFATGYHAYSQISQGGTPPSFIERSISKDFEIKNFPAPDVEALIAEDEENKNKAIPLRVGVSVPVGVGIDQAGTWTVLPNGGKIWRLALHSEGNIATGVYFDDFYLPKGGELYVYNESHEDVLGAFTSYNNHSSGLFATQLVGGDVAILEYYQPENVNEEARIHISEIAYNYKQAAFPHLEGERGTASWWCMINVNCEEGDDWQKEKKGVVKQYMKVGWYYALCSGTLINNTEWDRTPYVLTASHCGYGASASDLNQWVFYFNYEASTCNGTYGPSNQTVTGADLKAWDHLAGPDPEDILGSDFYLVELNNSVPTSYDPYFNGWDKRNVPADSAVCIHHPDGDIKKISTTYNPVYSSSWVSTPNTHWRLFWSYTPNGRSITQGGSSGSPLFNQNHHVVGDLTGGYASSSCESPSPAFYGKFSYSWDQNGSTAAYRLKDWLDPNELEWNYCDGVSWEDSPPIVDFTSDTAIVNMGDSLQFYDLSENYPNEWEWTIEGTDSVNYYVKDPKVVFADSGWYNVQLVATNPDGTGDLTKEDYIYVNFVELPGTDFTSDTTMLSPFESVNFFDLTSGEPFAWEWAFEGGTPNSSTDQNPENIKYYASGLYDVSLTATNGGGSKTMVKEDYINVVWVGIDENDEVQNIKLFPNPTTGAFTLEFLNLDYDHAIVKVYDLGGNLVQNLESTNSKNTLSIDIEDQPEGVYYLNIKVDDDIFIDKVSLVK
ncbi:MAG: T9SS type A sorting domain-containing protein [Bacteroidales bacterium]|nr:T9SS type A sorting domain-containing protein [Bacteroidales bacterium]MCF8398332.1 T9SS type A sorting domain-containing protein [Bacteroidales bacterium]